MIDRYSRPEMKNIWSLENKFNSMMAVEIAVAKAQAQKGIIPKNAYNEIKRKSKFQIDRINEIEKTTKHDVIAFVTNMAENVGKLGRYIHFGLTSSDVLDTAISLQIKESGTLISNGLDKLEAVLKSLIKKHSKTICAGRTHGMHAEPTTFGLKLAGFLAETQRNHKRFKNAINQCLIGKLSGAVGTYATSSMEIEELVCKELKLESEKIATQVIPRDRHSEVFFSIAMIGAGIERLSIELRHLQRTEVSEVIEGFTPGQKGSSAMPHKKNPISSENLTGAARLLRSYLQASLENIALWHERDISHSSVERVIFPDAFILCDYAIHRMIQILENLFVDKEQMLKNMDRSSGHLFSSQVLLALVEGGISREEAYKKVQSHAHNLKPNQHLFDSLKKDKEILKLVSLKSLEKIFAGDALNQRVLKVLKSKKVLSQKRSDS